jgi:hypothetical protein
MEIPDYLNGKVLRSPGGCWEWTGRLTPAGYATYKGRPAHRTVYEQMIGPIADGLHIDHLCRNTACVNPEHLEPVDPKVNNLRGYSPPAINARKTTCKNGHPYDGDNLYQGRGPIGRRCRQCGREEARAKRAAAGRKVRGERSRDTIMRHDVLPTQNYMRGERQPASKLTDADVLAIREAWCDGVKGRDLAKRYSVHASLISQIVRRKAWKHV